MERLKDRKKLYDEPANEMGGLKETQEYIKETGSNKFWDSPLQKNKAWNYANSHGLDYSDIKVKEALREMYRTKEGKYTKSYKGKIKRQVGHGGELKDRPYFQEELDAIDDEKALNNPNMTKKEHTIQQVLRQNIQTPSAKTTSVLSSAGDGKPEPTGFKSKLPIADWLIYYLPQLFEKGLYDVQHVILKHQEEHPWNMTKVFRSAGKSVLDLGVEARALCQDPNERIFILGEEYKKTVQRVRLIRNFLASPRVVEDYGYLINEATGTGKRKGKSTEGMFECYRTVDAIEPSVMAITWKDSQALGMHYTRGLLDDPWSNKLENTKGALEKWLDWWAEFQGSLDKCYNLTIICTRKGLKDLYYHLGLQKQFKEFSMAIIAESKKCRQNMSTFNACFSRVTDCKKQANNNIEKFKSCMQ